MKRRETFPLKKKLKKRTLHGFVNIAEIEGIADKLSAMMPVTGDMKAG